MWPFDQFDNLFKRQSVLALSYFIISRQYRYIVICINKRMCSNVDCKQYKVSQIFQQKTLRAIDDSNSGLNENYDYDEFQNV